MCAEPQQGVPLTRESLFRLIADEVCNDGVVEDQEKAILEKMAVFLRLDPEEARTIAREAWSERPETAGEGHNPLDPRGLYAKALRFSRSDGTIDRLEEQMLAGLRKLFHITDQEHEAMLLGQTGEEAKITAVPGAGDAGKSPPPPLPAPGSTTGALGRRLEHDPLEAWTEDHRFWYPVARSASDPARKAWETFLRGMENGDEEEMDAGLDALDDLLNVRNEIMTADAVLGLAVVRWSRVLLRTTFSPAETGEARHWPGMPLYRRLTVKMPAILITIEHLQCTPAIEKGVAMSFVFLLEDLCMLIRRRHSEPIAMLGELTPMVAKISPKAQVMHQAVELLGLLATTVGSLGGEIANAFVFVCRGICRAMPQNHPLTLAAHASILAIVPGDAVFPVTYQPRANTVSVPSCPQAVQRLDRLIAEVRGQQEEERQFVEALSGNLFRVERKLLPAEQLGEAERCLDQALDRHPWMSKAWVRKGLLAKKAGNLKAAREAFEKAAAVSPTIPMPSPAWACSTRPKTAWNPRNERSAPPCGFSLPSLPPSSPSVPLHSDACIPEKAPLCRYGTTMLPDSTPVDTFFYL